LDLVDTYRVVGEAVEYCRSHQAPVFLHLSVVRMLAHAGSDAEHVQRFGFVKAGLEFLGSERGGEEKESGQEELPCAYAGRLDLAGQIDCEHEEVCFV